MADRIPVALRAHGERVRPADTDADVSVDAHLEVVLADGSSLVRLAGDRGLHQWGPIEAITLMGRESVELDIVTCLGPDEPAEGQTQDDAEDA